MGDSGQAADGKPVGMAVDPGGKVAARQLSTKKQAVKKKAVKKKAVKKRAAKKNTVPGQAPGKKTVVKKRAAKKKPSGKRVGKKAAPDRAGGRQTPAAAASSERLDRGAATVKSTAVLEASQSQYERDASNGMPPPIEDLLNRLKNDIEAVDTAAPAARTAQPIDQAATAAVPSPERAPGDQGRDGSRPECPGVISEGAERARPQPLAATSPRPNLSPRSKIWFRWLLALAVTVMLYLYFAY